jgi:hypothetical protein
MSLLSVESTGVDSLGREVIVTKGQRTSSSLRSP